MSDGTTAIPFGKHKGKTLEEIPSDYLKWMFEAPISNEDLALEAENEYAFREKNGAHFWS